MPRLRLRNRATVERASPNPAGDGAGNFQDGWDRFVGPVSMRIEPRLSGGESNRDGQEASRQQFYIHLRADKKTRLIDARDRVREVGGQRRLFNVLANVSEPSSVMVMLVAEQTAVQSPQPPEYESGYESEGVPTFPVGP